MTPDPPLPRLLIATGNPSKLREIQALLADTSVVLMGLRDLPPVPEPEETGATFQENARLKARYYDLHARAQAESRGACTVAEDSGLVIDALDGEPGVRSARFLRDDASYPDRFAEIYRRLAERPERPRTARFVCALAVVRGGALLYEASGVVEGEIASTPGGNEGFGYDPIFWYPPLGRTLAELQKGEKQQVSHRGQAFRQLTQWLGSAAAAGPSSD